MDEWMEYNDPIPSLLLTSALEQSGGLGSGQCRRRTLCVVWLGKRVQIWPETGTESAINRMWLSPWLSVIFLQSCHIGEEDEGGEQEGEEPSFEVRQTEMVWGDQGRGDRGVSGEATPPALSDHTMTSHSAHPPHLTLATAYLFFLFSSGLSLVHLHHLSTSCSDGLTCACLCWALPTSGINVVDSICS